MNFKTLRTQKATALALIAAALGTAAVPSMAAPIDFSSLTSAVDFSTVVVAILAIGGLLAVPGVAKKGTRFVLSMIGR